MIKINRYRPIPFWAWNGEMTEDHICGHLQKIKEGGFGGVFVHPRPGLITPYLSEEWIRLWGIALKEAKRLDMQLLIYDENTYPTGYAGGHVMSRYPDCAARSVKTKLFKNGVEFAIFLNDQDIPEEVRRPLKVYAIARKENLIKIAEDLTEIPVEKQCSSSFEIAALIFEKPYSSVWFGGFPSPDILRPEVTRGLLESTYELYYKHFGEDFGTWIPAVFSDEPGISPGNVDMDDPMSFPYSPYLAYEFYQRHGYSLIDHMAAICLNIEVIDEVKAEKIRYDYYCLLRELWIENFARPVHDWCEEHKVAWTGHFLDEHWPYPWGCASPSIMSMYEWMHWPGIDMLMTHMLKEDGRSPMLLSIKELESVGEQLGKERLLCECYGAGGWDASVDDFKRIGDWLAVHGINLFNPHLILDSVAGVRKHGHPQSFDWREPWWKEYGTLNEYFARLCQLLSEGRRKPDILLIHPTTTWFLQYPQQAQGNILWNYEEMDQAFPVKTYIEKLQYWTQRGLNYDLGDEFLLERYGSVTEDELCVGEASYKAVYIPQEMKHMRSATKSLLEKASRAGVQIYMEENQVYYMDGELQKTPVCTFPICSIENFMKKMEFRNLLAAPFQGFGITVTRRILENGSFRYFFINSTPQIQRIESQLRGNRVKQLDLFTGEERDYYYKENKNCCVVSICLNPGESLMLECNEKVESSKMECTLCINDQKLIKEILKPTEVLLEDFNALSLDYGALILQGKRWDCIHVMEACKKIYQHHGWEQNPWDMAVQFRDRFILQNVFPDTSGFIFEYSFAVEEVPEYLYVAAEHPKLIAMTCNGKKLLRQEKIEWMDEVFGIYEIPVNLLNKSNVISMEVQPFDLCMELQPIYLLGNFTLEPSVKGFRMKDKKPLGIGELCGQGVYFYSGRVNYRFRYSFGGTKEQCRLYLGAYEATALSIIVNNKCAGQSGTGAGQSFDILQYLHQGENEIQVELSCSLKNLFGPHHTPCPIRNSAWPNAFKLAPPYVQPAGLEYDCIDYGLKEDIWIESY